MRLLSILALCLLAQRAEAESKIVIVETRGAPSLPALATQVGLHTGATVTTQQAPDADPTTYAETASQQVSAGTATLVVWIAPVDRGYLVFVAGRSTGRSLTELVRIDASVGAAEIERTIALKVAGLLDDVLAEPAKPVTELLAVHVEPRPTARSRHEWRLEAAGFVAYETHERGADGRVGIATSRAWIAGPWSLAPWVGGYWQPSGTIERTAGRASIMELGGIVAAEGTRDLGIFEIVARPRFVAAGLTARGVSNDGRRGTVTVFAPYAGLELGVRRAVSNVRFGALFGCDFALIHRELVIDNATVVDLGRLRLHVGLAMTVSL